MKTILNMDLLGEFDFRLCYTVIGTGSLLAFIVIAIPLNINSSSINEVAFMAYSVVYCWYGFVLLRLIFEYSLPGLSRHLYLITFLVASLAVTTFYLIHFSDLFHMSLGVIRTVPPSISTVIVMAAYLLHAVQYKSPSRPSNLDVRGSTVAATTSPMRNVFNVDTKISQRGSVCNRLETLLEDNEQQESCFGPGGGVDRDAPDGKEVDILPALQAEWFGLSSRCGDMDGVEVVDSPVGQWMRCVAALGCISATYLYCQWLALTFSSTSGALGEVGIYIVFALSFSLLRPAARYLGFQIDQHKSGGPSVEVLMEMGISFFYFTFYRNLFVSVRSYLVFFVIKGIHVSLEMVNYSLCFSLSYRQALDYMFLRWNDFPFGKRVLRIVAGCKSVDMFVQLQCIKTGMRLYLFLSSALTFMLFFTFLRFGYNKPYYCVYEEMDHNEYVMLMNITSISICIELGLYVYTDSVCRSSYNHGVLATWQALLNGKLGGSHTSIIIYMIWLLAHVSTDIYLSRLDVSSIGGIDCPDNE